MKAQISDVNGLLLVVALALLAISTLQLFDPIIGLLGAGEAPTWVRVAGLVFALASLIAVGGRILAFRRKVSPKGLITVSVFFVLTVVTQVAISSVASSLNAPAYTQVEEETVLDPSELPKPADGDVVRIAFLGDSGNGNDRILAIGQYLAALNGKQHLDGIVLLGDNIYNIPEDGWEERYEYTITSPFKPLFDAKVPFYALLGNHDLDNKNVTEKMLHDPRLNMNGERYYKVDMPGAGGIGLFLLDAEMAGVDTFQTYWLQRRLSEAEETWKLVLIHKPAKSEHGGNPFVRAMLQQVELGKHGVQMMISGDDHNYQRHELEPGVLQIVNGGSSDRKHLRHETDYKSIAFYDDRESFLLGEFTKSKAHFKVINDLGEVVDEFDVLPNPS